MPETTAEGKPDFDHNAELERQASSLLTEIMDNPGRIGANIEDGSYSRKETEHGFREDIALGAETHGLKLRASRIHESDPELYLPGKFGETITIRTYVPGIAELTLIVTDTKHYTLEYGAPADAKGSPNQLEDAIDAIKIAVDEFQSAR